MEQLILNNLTLPETSRDKYRAYEEQLSVQLQMASGRMVREVRGKVWRIEWAYDYMNASDMQTLLGILRGSGAIEVTFLPDTGGGLITSDFWVTNVGQPMFAFSRTGVPYWHNISFALREVEPHD